ncbi:hypothetical protein [Bifidobacterium pseudolongum]|uniref:Uncharacterized protein n=1 Tax=Bifidobacterium pseudolongum subsp. globosum TaxID=1690 RepID=A0A4Q5ARF4_9BIFI|nr:hypothetical protein [Bifidobacterium pseudolongum]RYQ36622.1 hypothetical protein PG2003B_1121 [Bifidobacterium pseudolongum subsp. globosum]
MATIHISLKKPTSGQPIPVDGKIRIQPIRRFIRGNSFVLPEPFEITLENGEANVTLIESEFFGAWAFTELPGTPQEYTRYVKVPTTAAGTTLEYTDLEDVNPNTLIPVALEHSQLLQVAVCADAQSALAYSTAHPDVVVIYDEEAAADANLVAAQAIAASQSAASQAANDTQLSAQLAAKSLESVQSVKAAMDELASTPPAVSGDVQSAGVADQTVGE